METDGGIVERNTVSDKGSRERQTSAAEQGQGKQWRDRAEAIDTYCTYELSTGRKMKTVTFGGK